VKLLFKWGGSFEGGGLLSLQVQLVDLAAFRRGAVAEVETGVDSFGVQLRAGSRMTISPAVFRVDRVHVLGGEWLVVTNKGELTFEGMVHTPSQFPAKSVCVRPDLSGWSTVSLRQATFEGEDALLVGGCHNYYHWLVDYLPRLLLAWKAGLRRSIPILLNEDLAPYQRSALERLGIDQSQMVHVRSDECMHVRKLWVPTFAASTTVCHPVVPVLLRQCFVEQKLHQQIGCRRIFLTRSDADTRRAVNEADLWKLLELYGFERVIASELKFEDQVALFSQASVVVGLHGAGLANILFCPKGTAVIEISLSTFRVTSMLMLARVCGLRHEFSDACIATEWSENPLLNDWLVDLVDLNRRLSVLLQSV
jgi:hypothetical protein